MAELNGLDMLVFTGGIGENDIASRAEICAGLGALGIVVDAERNNVRGEAIDLGGEFAGDGARDSAGGRSDDCEPRGAAAGGVSDHSPRFCASDFSCSADTALFYTGEFDAE